MKTIAIIGAGAAGLMAAATLVENAENLDFHIHLFEKNMSPGKKVIISWGGRCNVTTSIEDRQILAMKYTRGWEFIKKSMWGFGPKKCREWFESHGVPLKIQPDMRVFPVSDDGRDIVGVFEDVFAKYRDNITLHYGEWITDVSVIPVNTGIQTSSINTGTSPGWQKQSMYQLTTPRWAYTSDILVITTGWNAYSQTGSTGDGYAFARALGHSVTRLGPSLSSFLTKESWMHALSWVALEDARIGNLRWPILLTHFGLSGPLAFMLSSRLAWEEISPTSGTHITLAPRADIDTDMWDIFFRESFALHPKKLITSILSEKLTRRFAESIIDTYFAHIRETFVGSIGKWDRLALAKLLWDGIDITLLERRPGDEFVTAGGVDTSELDSETMQSRIQKHLYFAGEVLNVDGYTGGFSLQICWSSGYVAGLDIAKNL